MERGFAARVVEAVGATGPLCAGIDPSSELLAAWGLDDTPAGLRTFGLSCVEAFAGVAAVVKPQVAFFERMGSAGMAVLEEVLAECRRRGLLAIADAKRGDIGSTMEAYAAAWLDPASPLVADAVTAVAYLGLGALRPAFDRAAATGRGVIVVARSSNPEGESVQGARVGTATDAPTVADALLADIAAFNRGGPGVAGTVGAVVGATLDPSAFDLAGLGGVILAPGMGAQGGTTDGVAALFKGCPTGTVLPSASRSLLAAGPDVASLRAEAERQRHALAKALT